MSSMLVYWLGYLTSRPLSWMIDLPSLSIGFELPLIGLVFQFRLGIIRK